jgi:hypothetical protein
VSATPASAEKIASVVIPYLNHHEIEYKIIPTAPTMRKFYASSRYKSHVSQFGKFITIYPDSIQSSVKILNDLDQILNNKGYKDENFVIPVPDNTKKFVESDFVNCVGEFSVSSKCENGIKGALSVRYVNSYKNDTVPGFSGWEQRIIPVIDESQFKEAFPDGHNPFSDDGFTLSYCGINLPKTEEGHLRTTLEAVGFLTSAKSAKKSPGHLMKIRFCPTR